MHILITGGAGFIGSNLTKTLLEKGYGVWVIDNLLTGNKRNLAAFKDNPSLHFLETDLVRHDFQKNLKAEKIELIFHLASPASPIQYAKYPLETLMVNSLGTKNVLDFAKNKNAKIVFASTSEVYGDPDVHPQTESYWGNVNSFGPRACYDEAKRFAEALCYTYLHQEKIDLRIVRIFNTYGPNMEVEDGRVISNFIVQALQQKPITIYGDGKQTRSCCYVSDLISGLIAMSEKPVTGEIINLGNPEEKTVLELAQIIKKLTKSSSKIVLSQPLPKDDPKKRKPDIDKARRLLNWEPQVKLEAGLNETIKYFQQIIKKN